MNKSIFAVFDAKAGLFGDPFVSVNTDTAIRDFAHAVNTDGTQINRYPEDYALHFLGNFNDETGEIQPGVEIILHGNKLVIQPK